MKLLLLLVVLIAVFAANCRDVPDGHPIQAFTFEQQDLPPVAVDHGVTEGDQYIVNRIENEKGQSGTKLRGKKDTKTLKVLVQNIKSLDDKLTKAILNQNKELQSIREKQDNITESDKTLKMDLETMKQSMTKGSSIIIPILNSIAANQRCKGTDALLVRNQCFQVIRDKQRNWQDAQSMCSSLSLILAEPTDNNAALLRKYMVEKYGTYECWLGARGDGTKFVWQSSGRTLLKDNSLWDDNFKLNMSSDYCLELDVRLSEFTAGPGKPYEASQTCTTAKWALCEVL